MDEALPSRDHPDMRVFLTAGLWFLAAWVCVDMACYALGLPRQATPLVAILVGLVVASWLHRAPGRKEATSRPERAAEEASQGI